VPPQVEHRPATLCELFAGTVERYPDRAATRFSVAAAGRLFTSSMTYRQLGERVDAFAASLQRLGVAKGDRVALFMPNCPQFVIAYLGALRAGAIAVPFNPLYSARETEYQLKDSGAKVVVVLSRFYPLIHQVQERTSVEKVVVANVKQHFPLPLRLLFTLAKEKKEGHRVQIDRAAGACWFEELLVPGTPAPVELTEDDTAVLLYSGGTTGISKGAELTHRNLVFNAEQNRAWASLQDGQETTLAVLPLFHAFGLTCSLNLGMMTGATLLLIPDPRDLTSQLMAADRFRATVFPVVPTMLVAISGFPNIGRYDLRSIRVSPCAGAPLAAPVQRAFHEKTGVLVFEGYGLTEASPVALGNPPHGENRIGTIGLPYPDTEARVVDAETGLRELPFEPDGEWTEPGEIVIRGPQVMKGYWRRPDETAQMLRDGWLFTGDIGQMHRDGYFRIVDRKKDLIIRGGMNVFPAEVEAVLYEHPKVKEVLVIGVPDAARGELVKAFAVLKPGESATEEEILAHCRQNLARYKVPSAVEFRAELPRSAVGKLLRRVLRDEVRRAA
jgi:long-chain acyl-CoA synthetase